MTIHAGFWVTGKEGNTANMNQTLIQWADALIDLPTADVTNVDVCYAVPSANLIYQNQYNGSSYAWTPISIIPPSLTTGFLYYSGSAFSWANNPFLTELDGTVTISPAPAAGWVDWDIHTTIGAAVHQVMVMATVNATQNAGVRTKGSVQNRYRLQPLTTPTTYIAISDPSGFIQVYADTSNSSYYLMGYW